MTTTYSESTATTSVSSYGGFVDAFGGIATVVLAIVALAGVNATVMVPIAVIVFGAALLIQGGTLLSEHARMILPAGSGAAAFEQFSGGSLSAVFLVGASGIVLGVLALLGIAATMLSAVAIIAFGAALVMTSNSVRELHVARRAMMRTSANSASELVAGEMAAGSAGVQLLAGLTAVVLGILAVAGTHPPILILSALIVLGATVLLSGSALSGIVMGFMRPAQAL